MTAFRLFTFGFALLAMLVSMASCTYSMCHPYKLVGLCEYVGRDGSPRPR